MKRKVFTEKSGNPVLDNRGRKLNKSLSKVVDQSFKVDTPKGRRRKKELKKIEGDNYAELLVSVSTAIQEGRKRLS